MIYGALATGCGYPFLTIDAMTLLEVEAIYAYWQDHPPTHLLVGAFLGAKPSASPRNAPEALARSHMRGIPGMKEGIPDDALTLAEFDFAQLKRRHNGKK